MALRHLHWMLIVASACRPASTIEAGDGGVGLPAIVELPNGAQGIGLDDLRYSMRLGRIVSPAGRTGAIDLVDPKSLEVTSIAGFTADSNFDGSDLQGVESADEGGGFLFGNDRSADKLGVLDPATKTVVASVQLELTEPDYVRYVESTSEVWITQPSKGRVEVLAVPTTGTPTPVHAAFIPVPGGVEGLAIDNAHHQAYTHSSQGTVAVINLDTRLVTGAWNTGCSSQHGIPQLDEQRGWLFTGCSNARVAMLDVNDSGKQLGSFTLGSGATILAYAPALQHFYLRGDGYPTVAVLQASASGLKLLGSAQATSKGHCMAADDQGNFWVCDWSPARLLRFKDPFPGATP